MIWISEPLSSHKTKARNIIKILPGPKINVRNTLKELDAFFLFITEEMIDEIVTNTNRYIENKRNEVNYARIRDCRDTSRAEIKALLGALYLIGVKKRWTHKLLWALEFRWHRDGYFTSSLQLQALPLFASRSKIWQPEYPKWEERNIVL